MKSKFIFLFTLLFFVGVKISAQSGPSAEDICNSTVSFLNALGTNNFQGFMSSELVGENTIIKQKTYASNTEFPGAISTVIVDTSSIKAYRIAKVYYANANTQTETLDAHLLELYKNFNLVLEACLVPNKFTSMNDEQAPFKFYDMETSYSFEMPGDNLFSSNFMQVKIYIDVYKDKSSGYFQELTISFTII